MEWVVQRAIGALVALVLVGLSTLCVGSAMASGQSDFCYVEFHSEGGYTVYAHVPWRVDRKIAVFGDPVTAQTFQYAACGGNDNVPTVPDHSETGTGL